MASCAIRRVLHTLFDCLAVNTLREGFGNFGVTFSARRSHVPVANLRRGIFRTQNSVASMAIGARGRFFALHYCAPVRALKILFDGMQKRNLVSRQESRIGVAPGARTRLILSCYLRTVFRAGLNCVNIPVARIAIRGIRIAFFRSLPVDAPLEGFYLICMALCAFCRLRFHSGRNFMRVSVAGRTGLVAQKPVDALWQGSSLLRMTFLAFNFFYSCRMRKILDIAVAVATAQDSVRARRVFFRANRDVMTGIRLHARLPMACQARFVGLREIRFCLFLRVNLGNRDAQ